MQYNLEDLKDQTKVRLEWHGEPTRVRLEDNAEKIAVNTGDVLEVSIKQARSLLRYSSKWTMEGDKPVKHAFDASQVELSKAEKKSAKKVGARKSTKKQDEKKVEETDEKKEVMKKLKELEVTFNDQASVEELKALLAESTTDKSLTK